MERSPSHGAGFDVDQLDASKTEARARVCVRPASLAEIEIGSGCVEVCLIKP
jgi:hypothetical protein